MMTPIISLNQSFQILVVVTFPLDEDANVNLLAWTTTPYTLPSNLALCVNPVLTYVKIKDIKTSKIFVLMQDRLEILYKKPNEYEILSSFPGKDLENKTYQAMFGYFAHLKHGERPAFRVLCDEYVTSESGTGIVHQAPYFGEVNFFVNICMLCLYLSKICTLY